MTSKQAIGPGTLRVGRFIGRLGVISLPAVSAGLDLDQRVVRRHVAKLEAAGWLVREPWTWGEGSVAWLTNAGIEAARLGGVRPLKSPPGPTTITHGVLVGWSAARAEHRGRTWRSARELALADERWAAPIRCERGYTTQLPDLAVWLKRSKPPVALIAESGGRREDRQKMILQGWQDAILTGRYGGVRYDCVSPSVARWIARLARKVGLTASNFAVAVQPDADEIAALPRATEAPDEPPADNQEPAAAASHRDEPQTAAPVRAPQPQAPSPINPASRPPEPPTQTPEQDAERERVIREVLGHDQPERRRRWRR